jgi:nucleoside-diphosphate-sugar epimerase
MEFVPRSARVLYSIPALDPDPTADVLRPIAGRVERVVYLSTTSVYGAQRDVDESTAVAPLSPSAKARVVAERQVLEGPWSSMVLRPAAIYGPGRGVHVKMKAGAFLLAGAGLNYVSRIHVEDLAAVCEAALLSEVGGAWPVADEEPCPSREIAQYCADLLGVPMAREASPDELHATRRSDRRVEGSAVLRKLGVRLRYPSYRQGIPASV